MCNTTQRSTRQPSPFREGFGGSPSFSERGWVTVKRNGDRARHRDRPRHPVPVGAALHAGPVGRGLPLHPPKRGIVGAQTRRTPGSQASRCTSRAVDQHGHVTGVIEDRVPASFHSSQAWPGTGRLQRARMQDFTELEVRGGATPERVSLLDALIAADPSRISVPSERPGLTAHVRLVTPCVSGVRPPRRRRGAGRR